MNNTFNIGAMDTVYPFIPMYPNGQPQGNFLVNGLSAPVLIPKRAASSPSRHEWFGYLKVMAPATCFLHLHAHSSISLSIPTKDLELSTEPGSDAWYNRTSLLILILLFMLYNFSSLENLLLYIISTISSLTSIFHSGFI